MLSWLRGHAGKGWLVPQASWATTWRWSEKRKQPDPLMPSGDNLDLSRRQAQYPTTSTCTEVRHTYRHTDTHRGGVIVHSVQQFSLSSRLQAAAPQKGCHRRYLEHSSFSPVTWLPKETTISLTTPSGALRGQVRGTLHKETRTPVSTVKYLLCTLAGRALVPHRRHL